MRSIRDLVSWSRKELGKINSPSHSSILSFVQPGKSSSVHTDEGLYELGSGGETKTVMWWSLAVCLLGQAAVPSHSIQHQSRCCHEGILQLVIEVHNQLTLSKGG